MNSDNPGGSSLVLKQLAELEEKGGGTLFIGLFSLFTRAS